MAKDSEVELLLLYKCTFSDKEIEAISKMKNITYICIDDCTGYSSLAPLADMVNLKELKIEGS